VLSLSTARGGAANAVPVPSGAAAPAPTIPIPLRLKGGDVPVNISVPLVLILGVVAYVAWRYMGLRAWQAILCLVTGFLLAATSAAPQIHQVISSIVRAFGGR
jgi:hypothetical protein